MALYQINYDDDFNIDDYSTGSDDDIDGSLEESPCDSEDEYRYAYDATPYVSQRRTGGIERELPVADIRYTHGVISRRFRTENRGDRDAPPDGPLLEDTFRELVQDPEKVKAIPRIPVMHHNGHYWAVNGNRRLFVYKSLHRLGLIKSAPVRVINFEANWFSKAYSTENEGKSVRVHGVCMEHYDKTLNNIFTETRYSKLAAMTRRNHVVVNNVDHERERGCHADHDGDVRRLYEEAKRNREKRASGTEQLRSAVNVDYDRLRCRQRPSGGTTTTHASRTTTTTKTTTTTAHVSRKHAPTPVCAPQNAPSTAFARQTAPTAVVAPAGRESPLTRNTSQVRTIDVYRVPAVSRTSVGERVISTEQMGISSHPSSMCSHQMPDRPTAVTDNQRDAMSSDLEEARATFSSLRMNQEMPKIASKAEKPSGIRGLCAKIRSFFWGTP